MESNPQECLYCQNNATLRDLMIEVCHLRVSRVFLFKEQTYRGRLLVAYDGHVDDLASLDEDKATRFMLDVRQAVKAIHKLFNPHKVNVGAYGDTLQHLHFHLVPKYEGGPDFGGVFRMNPKSVYLAPAEYDSLVADLRAELK